MEIIVIFTQQLIWKYTHTFQTSELTDMHFYSKYKTHFTGFLTYIPAYITRIVQNLRKLQTAFIKVIKFYFAKLFDLCKFL